MKNWKTTLTGAILAVLVAMEPKLVDGHFDFRKNWFVVLLALALFANGLVTKDHDVTGNPAKTIGEDAPVDPAAK